MKDEFITCVGVWGQRHYNYLKKHFPTVINVMRMNGTLEQHLKDIDRDAQDMFDLLMKQYAEIEGVTEYLEAHIDDVPESDSMTRYAMESKQTELDKMQKRIDRLMDMRMDGEITADVFMKQSAETQMKIDSLKDEIEALMPKKEATVTNYSEKLEMLRFAFSQYNAPEYFENGIPESVIDAYVEKIVVFEDYFEWYLRFGGNDPIKCRVNGKKDANPEVIFGDSSTSLTELEKHRLRSRRCDSALAAHENRITASLRSVTGGLRFGELTFPEKTAPGSQKQREERYAALLS